jgi:hypothetical protein
VALAGATMLPPLALAESQSADAVLPAGMSTNWDETSVVAVNAKRSQASLDGLWRFIPAAAGETAPPKAGWAYIKVPGSWGNRRHRGQSSENESQPSDFVALGSGPQWDNYDGAKVASAWYERQVPIPVDWRGRAISLRFDRVCTDAIVYVNGVDCGRVPWPWGSVDITHAVTPGKTADIRVLVAAIADSQKVGHFWQNAFMAVTYSAAKLATRGLTGSVYLESRLSEAHVSDAFVRTSTRNKDVALEVDLSGVKQAGRVHFIADMLNEKGEVDPRHVGRHGWGLSDPRWQQLLASAKEMFAGLKKLDPTRAYYSHEGSDTGDVHSANCYLDVLPLQEREEWLSAWAESGDMPVSMTEFGTPTDCSFRRGHDGFGTNIHSEPLLTEFVATYFGTDIYASEGSKYRQWLHDQFISGMDYKTSQDQLEQFPVMPKIQGLYRTNTWRSWRTAGLPGGLKTWSWLQDELKEINYPTLAWIAGPPEAYTAKDHHFGAGEKFHKQIVLINDTRQPQDFTATWIATVDGQTVGQGELHGKLETSEIRKLPFEITAPQVEAGDKADGQIALTATIGGVTHHDAFAFRVLGASQRASGRVAVVDPDGLTGKMLASLGYTPQAWNGGAAPLVVVGRNSLKNDPALGAKLEPFVRAGGRVLIFAQDPAWMTEALGWRVCPKVSWRGMAEQDRGEFSAGKNAGCEDVGCGRRLGARWPGREGGFGRAQHLPGERR